RGGGRAAATAAAAAGAIAAGDYDDEDAGYGVGGGAVGGRGGGALAGIHFSMDNIGRMPRVNAMRTVENADGTRTRTFQSSELCRSGASSHAHAPAGTGSSPARAHHAPPVGALDSDALDDAGINGDAVGAARMADVPSQFDVVYGQVSGLSEYPVLDDLTRNTWQWPNSEEYGDREYQLQIVAVALFNNTLVSLPTGLGKTFIAAVIMYNYYRYVRCPRAPCLPARCAHARVCGCVANGRDKCRWFPTGQVVFLAPTRPLVSQQIEACYRIVGMPMSVTAQMMGSVKAAERIHYWTSRRVFYCTPQTFVNDINHGRVDAKRIVLVVIDEGACYAFTARR
ncbi:DEAD/DEAH box helicase, partial [archaeon]